MVRSADGARGHAATSADVASWAEVELTDTGVKDNGSAPYFSWLAQLARLRLGERRAIGPLLGLARGKRGPVCGADTTSPFERHRRLVEHGVVRVGLDVREVVVVLGVAARPTSSWPPRPASMFTNPTGWSQAGRRSPE